MERKAEVEKEAEVEVEMKKEVEVEVELVAHRVMMTGAVTSNAVFQRHEAMHFTNGWFIS